jgi:hypothetical protein
LAGKTTEYRTIAASKGLRIGYSYCLYEYLMRV